MHLARRLQRLPRIEALRFVSRGGGTNFSGASAAPIEERIEIPSRVQRSPTDILQALAATVGRDPTAPHYKFHDDPFLIPNSNLSKRSFAMAQEAGRKAAKWIKEQHSELFLHQEAQPAIKDFAPKQVFTEESTVDEASLEALIAQAELRDAVFVYQLLKGRGVQVRPDLMQSMLELVCFYNNEEALPEEYFEERAFGQNNAARDRTRQTWKDGDLAEEIFAQIEPKTAASYAALIRGMAKYYQGERAYTLLQEAAEKGFEMDVTTFNAIIRVANFLKDTADQRWELCRDLLHQMAQMQLKPNLGTMNSLLECISTFGNFKMARGSTLKVLAELRHMGIEPSLGTFYFILIIFCRERSPVSHVLVDILQELQGKTFEIAHPKDTFFFATAMDVCRNHLNDKTLARKVDALLHTGNNYNLIGDSYKEAVYYRNFLALLCQTEPIDEFMQTYDLLVPNIYSPEPGIMEEILKAVEMNGAAELMPRLWSDMVIFDHTGRESLLHRTLQILVQKKLTATEQPLAEQFAKVALDIYTKVIESEGRNRKIAFTGQMIGDILALLVRGGNFEKAVEVFTHIDKNQHRIPGNPAESCLLEFIGSCVENKTPSPAIACLQYAVENQMETLAMAQRIHTGFTLHESHISKMKSLVGDAFLTAPPDSEV